MKLVLDVKPDSKQLAEMFSEMDADDQALFFNAVLGLDYLGDRDFEEQLTAVLQSDHLMSDGLDAMKIIGAPFTATRTAHLVSRLDKIEKIIAAKEGTFADKVRAISEVFGANCCGG